MCQKKNHFQVTVHIGVAAEPQYVRTPSGPQQVNHFQIKEFGIKVRTRLSNLLSALGDQTKYAFCSLDNTFMDKATFC